MERVRRPSRGNENATCHPYAAYFSERRRSARADRLPGGAPAEHPDRHFRRSVLPAHRGHGGQGRSDARLRSSGGRGRAVPAMLQPLSRLCSGPRGAAHGTLSVAARRSRHARQSVPPEIHRLSGPARASRLLCRAHRQGRRPLQLPGRGLAAQPRRPELRQPQSAQASAGRQPERLCAKLRGFSECPPQAEAVLLLVRRRRTAPQLREGRRSPVRQTHRRRGGSLFPAR